MKPTLVRLALIAAAVVPHLSVAQQKPLPTLQLNVGIHLIQAELANTFETRMTGLMHRKQLGANSGMLFVFPDVAPHCMWMKNTLVPLSVAFIDERGVILNIADMQPQTEESHCATAPARFALEMNQGWFAAKGIKPGAKLSGIEKAPPPR
ncbi:MAG TPA: DUF192 domain-containing protein [Burkholderiales bacterium]|nr:DUF192 domain-containing protein [Burkholderiales bacterium]